MSGYKILDIIIFEAQNFCQNLQLCLPESLLYKLHNPDGEFLLYLAIGLLALILSIGYIAK